MPLSGFQLQKFTTYVGLLNWITFAMYGYSHCDAKELELLCNEANGYWSRL